MSKEDILKYVIGAVLAGLIRPVIDAFMPSKERLRVYIKKTVGVSFAYLLPAGVLIETFFNDTVIDKFFVFKVSLYCSVLVLNTVVDLFGFVVSSLKRQKEESIEAFEYVMETFTQMHKDHIEITKELVQSHKKTNEQLSSLKDKRNTKF